MFFKKIEAPSTISFRAIIRWKNHPRYPVMGSHPRYPVMGSHKVFSRVVEGSDKGSKHFVYSARVKNTTIDKEAKKSYKLSKAKTHPVNQENSEMLKKRGISFVKKKRKFIDLS